ncbi:hypothetical protein HYFRA_00012994 [Hymenoscyphus fraxineus]|uniref:SET domain-containing protein n=1 Tax=Hymenoscyphus fraxineus TaxID=746836 RepID=A0A9N9L5X7_9HELO|nr:hypothetical protein HYFRA_00012994 [Hymenoscyphus fraxineus]
MIASVIAENPAMDYQSWRNGNRKLVDAWYKRYSKRPKKIPKSTYRKPREVVSSLEDRCSSSQFGLATLPLEKVNTSSQNWDLASPAAELDHDPRFSTKYFEVREAKGAGLGAFAIKDIKKGEVVMTEKPLFLATDATFWEKYQGLTGEQRDTYRSLHAWSKAGVTWENIAQSIFWTNRFRTYSEPGETGIFVKSSRFNHQCHPHANCSYFFYKDKNLLVFTVLKDIREGEEITISYSDKPQDFPYQYGFTCNCPRCLEAGRR